MGTFADALASALRRAEAGAGASVARSVDLDSAAAAAVAATVDPRPAWARTLGLPGPECTVDEVKRAFRRLALETHPDRGGASASFVAVTRAYDEAMLAVLRAGAGASTSSMSAARARRRAMAYEARA